MPPECPDSELCWIRNTFRVKASQNQKEKIFFSKSTELIQLNGFWLDSLGLPSSFSDEGMAM